MLNSGVIGMGVGLNHAYAYQNHRSTSLKSICDFSSEILSNLHSDFNNVSKHTNGEELLNDSEIDLISIASYDNYHFEQVIKSLENNKHVMVEKPLCLDSSELKKIHKVYGESSKSRLSANHVLRTNSRFLRLKNEIINNSLGEIFYIEGDYFWGRKSKLFGWRAEMDYYSIILGAAIHMIDLVMWLINSKPISVQAIGNNITSAGTNLRFNNFAVILLEFENGLIAKITGNGGCVHPHFHGVKIFGSKRTAVQNLKEAYFIDSESIDEATVKITEPYPQKETRAKIIHSFIDSIIDPSVDPIVSDKDVFNVMSVCLASEEAMQTGNKIEINYL